MIEAYRSLLRQRGRLREQAPARSSSELELQARFYRGEFGTHWQGTEGERIELLHSGRWNHEPGPDFRAASLRIDGREVRGDIEIDLRAADWEAHGHGVNRDFSGVALHGFFRAGSRRFFTRDCDHRHIPQVLLAESETSSPVSGVVRGEPLETRDALALVEAAAAYRLSRKRAGLLSATRLCGAEEALFQALATGLGYKNNKTPFLLVAQRVGLAGARGSTGEARLFGCAGFLQAGYFDAGDDEERKYLSTLWDEWWKLRDASARLILPPEAWNFSALRPHNHPHRRLGALAAIVRQFPPIVQAVSDRQPAKFLSILEGISHPYWDRRWNLSNATLVRPMALLGHDRALDLAINVFAPALSSHEEGWAAWERLPGPSPSGKLKRALEWLTGSDRTTDFSSSLRQQGLLQLYDDFFPEAPVVVRDNYASASTKGRMSAIISP